jgi:ribose 5-phosphate isomerase B
LTQLDKDQVRDMVRSLLQRHLQAPATDTAQPIKRPQRSARPIIDEEAVRQVEEGSTLTVPPGAIVTPSARDAAHSRRVRLEESTGARGTVQRQVGDSTKRTIAVGADHGGVALKANVVAHLRDQGFEVIDVGPHDNQSVDYPDYAYAVARLVSDGSAEGGIMIDGVGIGSCMAANKVPGVRAGLCYDVSTARNAREHNHANYLTLGGQLIGPLLARQIVSAWLETPFGPGRHASRVEKIMEIEQRYLKK